MKKGFFFFGFVVVGLISAAQNIHFLKSYGNTGYDYGRDIKQTADTGYIATGSSSSFSSANSDAFLLKVDSLGNFKWSYNYGGPDSDWGNSVAITYDSTYAVAGYTNSFGAGGFDFYLVRAGEFGVPLWEKTYGGSDWDKANSLAEIPADSGFVLVGETFSYGGGGKDMYIVRTDKNGDTLWTKTYGDAEDDWASGVIVDGDSIVVCGGTESYGMGMTDGIIMKMDLDGNVGWIKVVGQENEDYFKTIVKFSNYYLAGGTRSYEYDINKKDMWIYKISETGTELADTLYADSSDDDEINDLYINPLNQDITIAGYTKTWGVLDGQGDVFLSKFQPSFTFLISVTYGSEGVDNAYAIDRTKDNGFVVIGDMYFESTGGTNIFILKYNYSWTHIDIFSELGHDIITVSAEEPLENSPLKVYPNPTEGVITIESSENIDRIEVIQMSGQLVYEQADCDGTLNLNELPSGIYMLMLYSGDVRYSYRLIIQ